MANNVEPVTEQIIEDVWQHRIKDNYIPPTLTLLNETNIHSGTQVYVNENSNGGAFTSAS